MPPGISQPSPHRVYQPRNAAASPLYRIVQDHLETLLVQDRENPGLRIAPSAQDTMRAFLECGIHRFGVVRFRCGNCGESVFVPFSCKRRSCPTCDSKRAVAESAIALDGLLAHVPNRQWVLVLPKRLRFFVHRNSALAGEISRILGSELTRFYRERSMTEDSLRSDKAAAPSQIIVVQRFGERVNLHVHFHVAASDGVFALDSKGRLAFHPCPEPGQEDVARLRDVLRSKILRRMARLKALPEESILELRARPHGGFSLDGSVRVEAQDRRGLERLLRYVLRPAVSLKRLSYLPESSLVRYRPRKGDGDVLEWEAAQFLRRFAELIPPPRKHLVRYCGALGPRSRLRPAVTRAAREGAPFEDLLAGFSRGSPAVSRAVSGSVRMIAQAARAISARARSWAACLRRVFEVDPILCPRCLVEMRPVAAITADRELERLLAHLGWPGDFPKTAPARSPPQATDDGTQVDPRVELWEGIDDRAWHPRSG